MMSMMTVWGLVRRERAPPDWSIQVWNQKSVSCRCWDCSIPSWNYQKINKLWEFHFKLPSFFFQDIYVIYVSWIFVFFFKSPKSCSKTPELPGIFVGTPNPIWLPSWMCRENRNGGDGNGRATMGSLDVGAFEEMFFCPFLLRCLVVLILLLCFFCVLMKDP